MRDATSAATVEWPLAKDDFLARYPHPFLLVEYGPATELEYQTIIDVQPLPLAPEMHIYPLRKRKNGTFSFITLGRASNNDIVIKDPSVSKSHLAFHEFGGNYQVSDMGSKNGTKLNAAALEPKRPVALSNDDLLTLSQVVRIVFFDAERAYTWLSAHR